MSSHKRPEVDQRLARIEGHVRAVRKMLQDGRGYSEIAHQVSAIKASLDSVVEVIVDDLVEDCLATSKKREPMTEVLLELKQVVATK
jgi:CsoR family transcriptional regulator, copper-sensing transcriptional repressor